MSPESAVGQPWRQLFGMQCFTCKLALIAVDEAHCISEWLVVHVPSEVRDVHNTNNIGILV